MKVLLDSFNLKSLVDTLNNTVSLPVNNNSVISLKEYNCSEEAGLLTVQDSDGFSGQYVLVKINDSQRQTDRHLLEPVFRLRNEAQESYGAFDKKTLDRLRTPRLNHLEDIKGVLKTLAEYQASHFEDAANLGEFPIKEIATGALELKSVEKSTVEATLKSLQERLTSLLTNAPSVRSIWGLQGHNVYFEDKKNDIVFLKVASEFSPVPPAFDALLYVFFLSDEDFRKRHFQTLYTYYFDTLAEALGEKVGAKIDRKYIHRHLAVLLPIVKYKLLLDTSSTDDELLTNLQRYMEKPLLHQEDVYEILNNKLESNDYKLLDYNLVSLDQTNGHLGDYFHLNITFKRLDEVQHVKLFAKFLSMKLELVKDMEDKVEKKEDFFYNILYPTYSSYGLDDLLDFGPKCHLTRLSGFIVLDNLIDMNYTELKPNTILNEEGIKVVLEKIAKLHACSIIVEEKWEKTSEKPVRLNAIWPEELSETALSKDGLFKEYIDMTLPALQEFLYKFPELLKDLRYTKVQLQSLFSDLVLGIVDKVKTSREGRNVINHGDMHIANTLIRFDTSGKPETAKLIDFQVLRYIPPAYEVLFFIYLVSYKETRDSHFEDLLDFYYRELESNVRQHGVDLAAVIPRKEFDEEVERIRPSALVMAFLYAYMIHVDPEFREQLTHDQELHRYYIEDHKDEFAELCFKMEHYRRVIKGMVEDLLNIL